MLNEDALKMVGPTFEEVGGKNKGAVTPNSAVAVSLSLSLAYSPVVVASVYATTHRHK
ncbi:MULTISPECIES: hypothetical protein [Clostridium]|uniref:hypothetical protein n=1 Tax=Clostridium TaxID=1485 RepID=UPI0012FD541A|nr:MULTISPECIES: hypothetical protein [Clostridium]